MLFFIKFVFGFGRAKSTLFASKIIICIISNIKHVGHAFRKFVISYFVHKLCVVLFSTVLPMVAS